MTDDSVQVRMVQWYPGHIARAERQLKSQLSMVDVVLEVRDARIPVSTHHPQVASWVGSKPVLLIVNRADEVSAADREAWRRHYAAAGQTVFWTDGRSGDGVKPVRKELLKVAAALNAKRAGRGLQPRPVRACVIGFPNIGKSAIINRLVNRRAVASAPKPGVTRALRWVRVDSALDLLDAPGVIPASFRDQLAAQRLAICNDIGEAAYLASAVGTALVARVKQLAAAEEAEAEAAAAAKAEAKEAEAMKAVEGTAGVAEAADAEAEPAEEDALDEETNTVAAEEEEEQAAATTAAAGGAHEGARGRSDSAGRAVPAGAKQRQRRSGGGRAGAAAGSGDARGGRGGGGRVMLGVLEVMRKRYGIDPLTAGSSEDYVVALADRSFGGDVERAGLKLLVDYRCGTLGRFALERPADAERRRQREAGLQAAADRRARERLQADTPDGSQQAEAPPPAPGWEGAGAWGPGATSGWGDGAEATAGGGGGGDVGEVNSRWVEEAEALAAAQAAAQAAAARDAGSA
ncbi:hypothetical protein GPECTOR_9g688 [Gonium pectorale]|uniref:G domain-containing protein n=1 Tax=Gonium pectorale TaxID=33097 RepID=A0A150GS45_GONPE|nr:hypothetical protein GPECTOR_9g688 [Gonium pectorale]|eukprot:KXZ52643.1 hypothetical protein GPECTOR_9g688 [Gonium pectorale]